MPAVTMCSLRDRSVLCCCVRHLIYVLESKRSKMPRIRRGGSSMQNVSHRFPFGGYSGIPCSLPSDGITQNGTVFVSRSSRPPIVHARPRSKYPDSLPHEKSNRIRSMIE